jgi:uncharacterized protein
MVEKPIQEKKERLVSVLNTFDGLMVAFSGGVDSTFLLAVAQEVFPEKLVAVTAESPVHPRREKQAAVDVARELGVRQIVLPSREMSQPDFVANPQNRCYVCKKYLFEDLIKLASEIGIPHIAHGANRDDLADFRPGFEAAREMGIHAPMVEAGLTKNDIRKLSQEMNLKTWNAPPLACLATRIPYGTPLDKKMLAMIDRAEEIILSLGFTSCRVRLHDVVARIEVDPGDIERIMDQRIRSTIARQLREIGFRFVSVDLEGYNPGSMNRMIEIS